MDKDEQRLRDQFATAALMGMLTKGFIPYEAGVKIDSKDPYTRAAWAIADKMLARRSARQQEDGNG